ncbi:MAG: DUF503 family protein [Chloroflexi bacterium]|nr:DUF503 family protein [Chloroflexota bacterium]
MQHQLPTTAEVGQQDRWQIAELGVVCVSSDRQYARQQLEAVIEWLYQNRPDLVYQPRRN